MLITPAVLDKIEIVRGQFLNAVRAAKFTDSLAISMRQKINKAIDITVDDALRLDATAPPVPPLPAPGILPKDFLETPYGMISFIVSFRGDVNILWTDRAGVSIVQDTGVEIFNVGSRFYFADIDDNYSTFNGDLLGTRTTVAAADYLEARSRATKIITATFRRPETAPV